MSVARDALAALYGKIKAIEFEIECNHAAHELATRSRGTPRVANGRLHWVRSYATSEHDGTITLDIAKAALAMAEVDREGLDKQDRRYLEMGRNNLGPQGVLGSLGVDPEPAKKVGNGDKFVDEIVS